MGGLLKLAGLPATNRSQLNCPTLKLIGRDELLEFRQGAQGVQMRVAPRLGQQVAGGIGLEAVVAHVDRDGEIGERRRIWRGRPPARRDIMRFGWSGAST